MNEKVRAYIRDHYQPWRQNPTASVFRGPIGQKGTLQLNSDFHRYFTERGVAVDGRLAEELLEDDLLDSVRQTMTWLTPDHRASVDRLVAFGMSRTREPNACATRCFDGYAILFDHMFDTLLVSATEIYCGSLLTPRLVTAEQFSLALNTTIVSIFFQAARYESPIPAEGFAHRAMVNSMIWMSTQFFLAHELGHVVLGHLDRATERRAMSRVATGAEVIDALRPEQTDEFDADMFAVDTLTGAQRRGELFKPGSDDENAWNGAYTTLGWMFTVLEAIETIAPRLGTRLADTHPRAAERWGRISAALRRARSVWDEAIALEREMNEDALYSAALGPLPDIVPPSPGANYVAIPYRSPASAPPKTVSRDVLKEWIEATGPDAAREILRSHPELLTRQGEMAHFLLADQQSEPLARDHILRKRLLLLRRANAIGVDAAFEELARGALPVPTPVMEPGPDALKSLPDTLISFLDVETPRETEAMLEAHPELLHPVVDQLLDIIVEGKDENVRARVESFRSIIHRAREVGAIRAVLEAAIAWNAPEDA
jgi:hypothetical protein